jgi:hypothetical protein
MVGACFEPTVGRFSRMIGSPNAVLDGTALERCIGDIAERYLGACDAHLNDTSEIGPRCPTAVLATTQANADAIPHVFRSYITTQRPSQNPVRDVARATTATAGIFTPAVLGSPPVTFIDAGQAGYNNPAEIALCKAASLWPPATALCLVSLGTGQQKIVSISEQWGEIARASNAILLGCEAVHNRILSLHHKELSGYFGSMLIVVLIL